MTASQITKILKKYCTIPNQSKTKFFISEDKIPQIAGEIADKNTFLPPTLEEVKEYVKSKGYNEECAIKVYDYYTEMNWIDNSGKPVKSWKGKIVAIWLKPEYKITITKTGMVY